MYAEVKLNLKINHEDQLDKQKNKEFLTCYERESWDLIC